ncbi:MAG: LolA family protein [Salinivirgaceae bacterium]|jgi:outer membrane lipoprotein carrier protein|nr:outer membrane lipoprotein carrier protein LolA [Bacteroidales bacterium]
MKNLLLFLIVSLPILTNAQYDPAARTLLDKVSKNTKSWKTVKIEFNALITTAEPKTEENHKGTLWQKQDKYKLVLMESETYCNGKHKWVYMPEVEEVNLYNVDKSKSESLLDNPQQIFTIYTKGFKYQLIGEISEAGKTLTEVELVPENRNVEYFKIKVLIDKANNRIEQIKYFSKDGSRITVSVIKYTIDQAYPDDFFTFDINKHKDVILIDMTE